MAQLVLCAVNGSVCFNVPKISKLKGIWTQEFIVQDIEWKVNIKKESHDGKPYIAAYLLCTKKSMPANWSQPVQFSIKLLPFKNDVAAFVNHVHPFIYDQKKTSFGENSLITWDDLFDASKGYVKNDTIKLEFHVEVANQNPNTKSNLILAGVDKCRNEDCWSKYQLTVTNIENLMAIQSSAISLRNINWFITVYKSETGHLGVYFGSHSVKDNAKFKRTMSCKLLSWTDAAKSIEKVETKFNRDGSVVPVEDIVSWTDLMNPENGFIQNGSITIQTDIKVVLPVLRPIEDDNVPAKRPKIVCPICEQGMANKELSSLECGHTFCSPCIKTALETEKRCPTCKEPANLAELRRTLLPITN